MPVEVGDSCFLWLLLLKGLKNPLRSTRGVAIQDVRSVPFRTTSYMPMKAHIEGAPSSIRMASKERIAMHPAPRITICSGGESKRLVQCVLLF
jgi:hypothetical protein